ncbi:hypothetical protein VTK73DRAFT_3241 [Phialemonium thermophilum]|uniref:Diphthamide biosynthesis protein 4 n=1 Tax=Phialemonium thermophilum TaxID=223376 RepID=A0ABR3Y8T1_9PEZI
MPSSLGLVGLTNYYDVLQVSPAALDDGDNATLTLKRAYHRALLKHHPDKKSQIPSRGSVSAFTVDEICAAFAVLSDPRRRAEYDQARRLNASVAGNDTLGGLRTEFQTGIEVADLDDLDSDAAAGEWFRACRCGNPRGFRVTEPDLEDAAEIGEVMVGCQDCSLWLRVHFAVIDGEAEEQKGQ